MIQGAAELGDLGLRLRSIYEAEKSKYEPRYKKFALVLPSDQETENYAWLDDVEGVREFVGERVFETLRMTTWAVKNKKWERSVGIKWEDLRFDRLGQVKVRIQRMASLGAKHKDKLFYNTLWSGFSASCYDGQYFFDTDHPYDGGTWSNLITYALSADAFGLALQRMMEVMTYGGEPYDADRTQLVLHVGPSNMKAAMDILQKDRLANGEDNVWKGRAELDVNPRITDSKWTLEDVSDSVLRAVVVQEVDIQEPEFLFIDDPKSPDKFTKDAVLAGCKYMHNAGLLFPQAAVGSTGADAWPS